MRITTQANKSARALADRLNLGDCNRIAQALGLSLGYRHSRDDDSRGLAFTVCGGKLVNGEDAPEWLANMNGDCVKTISREALRRNAVKRTGRWTWGRADA